MGKLFGTDGVRGIAGRELTADLAYKIGLSASEVLIHELNEKPKIVIGKDTRISGDMFEAAVTAGLCAMGSDVMQLGVVPTPAVAYLVRELNADAGIMISASHNPSEYNGIKIFNGNGYKLSDKLENEIEEIISENIFLALSQGSNIGRVFNASDLIKKYVDHVSTILNGIKSRKVLIDTANGSASFTADNIFPGADFISCSPNGMNINDNCGSTHMKMLSDAVNKNGYDIGIAFDGDADRCLITDESGNIIDGDSIIALLAVEMSSEGTLANNTAVVTRLTNLGFHIMAAERSLTVKSTDVGDRFVLEEMLRGGYNLGGEQSGHIILTDYATTGDGQITAAIIINILEKYPELRVSQIFNKMKRLPQVSINVKVPPKMKNLITENVNVKSEVKIISDYLGNKGRIVLRPSGTEALIRIMLEGENENELTELGQRISELIERVASCGVQ